MSARHRIRADARSFEATLDGRKTYLVLPRERYVSVDDTVELVETSMGRETGSSAELSVTHRSFFDDPPACVAAVRVERFHLANVCLTSREVALA